MIRFLLSKGHVGHIFLFSTLILLSLTAFGCKRKESYTEKTNSVIYVLNESTKHTKWPISVKKRAEVAMAKWRNGVLDATPILVSASLIKFQGLTKIDLALTVFDEDRDTVGFGIREEYIDFVETPKILEEQYPVYLHCLPLVVADVHLVPTNIRTAYQKRDKKLWKDYLSLDYEKAYKEYLQGREPYDVNMYPENFWEETLPPVLISIPEPNKVDVWVWVYDKAGNKSDPVKLLNFTE